MHEKLLFSEPRAYTVKALFQGNVYDRIETQWILAEFEENGDESNRETSCTLDEILYDEGQENDDGRKNAVASLVLTGVNCRKNSY